MCGLAGFVTQAAESPGRVRLERMRDVLFHRGPDDGGLWMEHTTRTAVGLAHRRLSIIDLSPAGHQPMTNEDGTIWLIYNGEIYNHREVRLTLEARGHQYRSHTDSETIIHAYEEWGDACVERFRGMFAFALWDRRRQRLLLVRDRLGVKPLYYAERPGAIVFASEIKAVLESGVVPPAAATGALPEYLAFGYLAGDETLFEGVRKLQPGHMLVWQDGRSEVRQYWHLQIRPNRALSEPEAVERFRSLFDDAVRMRLMSDVPLGVFLSGGLDSSAIAAVMNRHAGGRLKTFSVGFDEGQYSELGFARDVARHLGADHHEVCLTPEMFLSTLPRLIWHEDEPMWAPPSVALYAVAALAARSVKVVLTGEGSDELFAGYDRYWMTRWNARALAAYRMVPGSLRAGVRRRVLDGPLPERWRRALGHTVIGHEVLPDGLVLDNWFSVFTPEMQRHLLSDQMLETLDAVDVHAAHRDLWTSAGHVSDVERMLYMDTRSNLVELLMKQDQMSMAASIESRVPFLDHKLVEFAATVPLSLKLNARSGKRLVKQALAPYLPDRIVNRPKKGFPVPFDTWLRDRYLPQIRELLLSRQARERGWFKPDAVQRLLEDHAAGRVNAARQIWNLWGLELWAGTFLDGRGSWNGADVAAGVEVPMPRTVAVQ
jgi:asparagine synthase (glutamine-hydrolysing)